MSERGRLHGEPSEVVVRHILEPAFREELSRYWAGLIWAQRAHGVMLAETGIVDAAVVAALLDGLDGLERDGLAPNERDGRLDLFFNVEQALARRVGADAAGRLHTGRSRNDLQATYQRMAVRERLLQLEETTLRARAACLALGAQHAATLLPGYTHMQVAQPITAGHWATAIHDSFARDSRRLAGAYQAINQCPLGAAALAGTSWPIDRRRTATLLGFDGLIENTLDAVASRDYLIDTSTAAAAVLTTCSRCATDLLLWSTWEFGFIELDDGYASISSIMPQKKNPLALEHCRARAAHGLAALTSVLALFKGIPFTHTRDTGKESFPPVFAALDQAEATVQLLSGVLDTLDIDVDRAQQAAGAGFSTATDLADALVRERGLSFRAAHQVVSVLVRRAIERGLGADALTPELLDEAAMEAIGQPVSLSSALVRRALDPRSAVEARSMTGGPAPQETRRMVADRVSALASERQQLTARHEALRQARVELDEAMARVRGTAQPASA